MNRDINTWKGEKNFGKIVSIDFDGCIADFSNGWQGPNVFGAPIDGASLYMNALKDDGWYICIFTTRLVTEELVMYLEKCNIPFNDINGRGRTIDGIVCFRYQHYNNDTDVDYSPAKPNFYWGHNPERASIKPIASVYIDDMNWENRGRPYTRDTWERIWLSLCHRFG